MRHRPDVEGSATAMRGTAVTGSRQLAGNPRARSIGDRAVSLPAELSIVWYLTDRTRTQIHHRVQS